MPVSMEKTCNPLLTQIKMSLSSVWKMLFVKWTLWLIRRLFCCLDPAMSFKGLSRTLIPEFAVDQQPAMTSSSSSSSYSSLPHPKDCDLDTESTVL